VAGTTVLLASFNVKTLVPDCTDVVNVAVTVVVGETPVALAAGVWPLTTGGAAAPIVMFTEALLLFAVPSLARYVNESDPLYPVVGVYVNDPSAFSVNVPCAGPVTKLAVSLFDSASVSLASTPTFAR